MQKQTIRLQGLLSASLLSVICNTYAQESVSSFEQSLINKSDPVKQAQLENGLAGTQADFDMEALAHELKIRGWDIQNKTDGSLILAPRKASENSSEIFSDKKADKNTTANVQWQQLQQKLKDAGWTAVLDTDGSMHLTPPDTAPSTKSELPSQTIKSTADTHLKDTLKKTQKKLQESGWNVTNNLDGSIFLYPPQNPAAKKLHICQGIKPSVEVSLPVDSWQEAYDIARGWLENESILNSTVGKIRKIFNVYIISIVSDKSPYTLMHQIAIKNNNGAVILLN